MPPYSNGTNTSWIPSSSPEDMRRTSSSGNSSRSSSSISSESGNSRLANSSIDRRAVFSMSAFSSAAMVASPFSVERLRHPGQSHIGPFPPTFAWNYGVGRRDAPLNVAAMNIAVAVRLMPKAGEELELDPSGTDIDREYVEL